VSVADYVCRYMHGLCCLCSQQRRLKRHDGKHDELERKEKGFMLYLNGANAATALPPGVKTARTARPKSCHKTATDCKTCCFFVSADLQFCCYDFFVSWM